ncbi:MAG: hypothetical protein EOR99_26515 [Mesorhizobium sp.]|nr:MAG: hypothetical protein EOR99_26515 [Mesorhizobium sp.]
MANTRHPDSIEVDRIYLYEENPRHEPMDSQDEIIEYLCTDEQVFNLARSISEAGPNPLQLVGLVQVPGSGKASTKKTYQVWEGNRRLCAIKLLNDPDLAPPHLRRDFSRLASTSAHLPIKKLNAVIFNDQDDLKFWMGVIHDGAQGGVGQLDWDAQQKARHFGTSRNRVALSVLDAAESLGFISKDERQGKLTTVQRFMNSSVVKEALGIDASNPDDLTYNRPLEDVKKQLSRFFDDLKEGQKVTSRMNRAQADAYGRRLAANSDITGERTEPIALKTITPAVVKSRRKTQPKKPRPATHLEYDKHLAKALEDHANSKLEALYYSICAVHIEHALLLTIGVWAFVESLAALAGKHADTDFIAFYSNQRLGDLGMGNGKALNPLRDALTRLSRNGNATKHHRISANFDGPQLANDLATITPLLTKTAESLGATK